MEQGLCSHFLLFFPCFLTSSAHMLHTDIPGSKVIGCLSCSIYTQFPEKVTYHILETDWDYMQFDVFMMPSFASNYLTPQLLLHLPFVRCVPMAKCLLHVRIQNFECHGHYF